MTELRVRHDAPEFRVVVRHRDRRGPLGPYRFALAVAFALLIAGNDLLDAASGGVGIDTALVSAATAAAFIWILSGIVSRILAGGRAPAARLPSSPAEPDANA